MGNLVLNRYPSIELGNAFDHLNPLNRYPFLALEQRPRELRYISVQIRLLEHLLVLSRSASRAITAGCFRGTFTVCIFSCKALDDLKEQRKMMGKVKWFNNSKGYGFLGRDDGPDVFVHYSSILGDGYRTLTEGVSVEFEIVQGPKGPQAADVRKVD